MTESKYITFKEIASLIEMSVDYVRSHESNWQLRRLRAPGFKSPIKFWRPETLRCLRESGLLR